MTKLCLCVALFYFSIFLNAQNPDEHKSIEPVLQYEDSGLNLSLRSEEIFSQKGDYLIRIVNQEPGFSIQKYLIQADSLSLQLSKPLPHTDTSRYFEHIMIRDADNEQFLVISIPFTFYLSVFRYVPDLHDGFYVSFFDETLEFVSSIHPTKIDVEALHSLFDYQSKPGYFPSHYNHSHDSLHIPLPNQKSVLFKGDSLILISENTGTNQVCDLKNGIRYEYVPSLCKLRYLDKSIDISGHAEEYSLHQYQNQVYLLRDSDSHVFIHDTQNDWNYKVKVNSKIKRFIPIKEGFIVIESEDKFAVYRLKEVDKF